MKRRSGSFSVTNEKAKFLPFCLNVTLLLLYVFVFFSAFPARSQGNLAMHGGVSAPNVTPPSPPRKSAHYFRSKNMEGDVLVSLATGLVFVATIFLVKATIDLNRTTKAHVLHSQALVETVKNYVDIDRIPFVAVSIVFQEGEPCISVQNVGRFPIKVQEISLRFWMSSANDHQEGIIPGDNDEWLFGQQLRRYMHPLVSNMFRVGRADRVLVKCAFRCPHTKAMTINETRWRIDQRNRSVVFSDQEAQE